MKTRQVIIALLWALCGDCFAADAPRRPNILFILTDDQGWADARFAGHPYVNTPNLDRLAGQRSLPPSKARESAAAGVPLERPTRLGKGKGKAASDRVAMFKAKDSNHDGILALEEYQHKFPDQAEGRRRFPLFDTNKDGVLSEEEFVKMGRP